MSTAHIYKDITGEWRFNIEADNGEIIASSESYHNKQDCINTAKQLGVDQVDI